MRKIWGNEISLRRSGFKVKRKDWLPKLTSDEVQEREFTCAKEFEKSRGLTVKNDMS